MSSLCDNFPLKSNEDKTVKKSVTSNDVSNVVGAHHRKIYRNEL